MRALLAALLLIASPAAAAPAGWITYTNDAWGYVLAVPDGFVNRPQTTDSSGAVFGGPEAEIMVWGEPLDEPDLEAKGDDVLSGFFGAGWNMMSQTFTPQSISLELRKGATVLHIRIIPVCEGKAVAQYRFGYTTSDIPTLFPVQEEMITEFRADGDCSAI